MDKKLLRMRHTGWKGDWSEREAEMGEKIGWLVALLYVGIRNLIHFLATSDLRAKASSTKAERPNYSRTG